jgi:hypothetical protein
MLRSEVRRRAVVGAAALAVLVALMWLIWPATGDDSTDVVVIGDKAVESSTDELLRRLRQEGFVPEVVVVRPEQCADVEGLAGDVPIVVVSFSAWTACGSLPADVDLVVEQPRGEIAPSEFGSSATVRPAALLFTGADRDSCRWWDTPGAGEDRPGLGRCDTDGTVQIFESEALTPAGRERFARLVAEAVK